VAVRALPEALDASTDAEALLGDLARDLDRIGASERLAGARDALLARIACHGAVRSGDPLTAEEMQRAVADLDEIPFAATCPHGRPLLFEIARSEIARRVGRG
jgi:DNA mismatch repair protein MutL